MQVRRVGILINAEEAKRNHGGRYQEAQTANSPA